MMAWLIARSIPLFVVSKLGSAGLLIYLVNRANQQKYIKVAFWAYLVLYCIGLVSVNLKGLL